MSAHTPGPWLIERDNDGHNWNVVCAGLGFERFVVGTEGLFRCDGSDEANARLIAAAPELLEALVNLGQIYDRIYIKVSDGEMEIIRSAWTKADAAIAKATGAA